MKWAVSVFKFFASLKLAIFLLIALALVFAVGTFMESAYGTEAAGLVVYRSVWMGLLLILLALNVAAAALDRLPWQKKHVGFVITHAGIILILAGSLVTRAYGIEGQMAVTEGETQSRMILAEPKLQLLSTESEAPISYALPRFAFPWKGRKVLGAQSSLDSSLGYTEVAITLLHYYPKASRDEKIEETQNGSPAIKVNLQSSFMKTSHWLFLEDPERSRIALGPAELHFSREALAPQESGAEEEVLEFHFADSLVKIPVPQKTPKKEPLKGTPYQVTVVRILRDAAVDGNQLIDQSQEWKNPAAELLLEGEGIQEKHTVFSEFPEFPTFHGMRASKTGVKIYYRRAAGASPSSKNELRFIWQESGLPLYQIKKGDQISRGELRLGEEYATGWMDFKFQAEHYYPHARVNAVFKEEPVHSQAEDHLSAIEIKIEKGGEVKTLWLGQGDRETVTLGGRTFQVVYGLRMFPVGFRIRLRDFHMEHYPGTSQPASFESDVTLMDDSTGLARDLTIRMNEPLKYRGFKVFQSGYQQPEGGAEVSIFTVAKDPGIPLKYGGAIVLIGGILIMFYSKKFSNQPKEKAFISR